MDPSLPWISILEKRTRQNRVVTFSLSGVSMEMNAATMKLTMRPGSRSAAVSFPFKFTLCFHSKACTGAKGLLFIKQKRQLYNHGHTSMWTQTISKLTNDSSFFTKRGRWLSSDYSGFVIFRNRFRTINECLHLGKRGWQSSVIIT